MGSEMCIRDRKETAFKDVEEFLQQLLQLAEDYENFTGVSASIGVAFTNVIDDVDILLKKSDVAMYEAKNSGKAAYRIAK